MRPPMPLPEGSFASIQEVSQSMLDPLYRHLHHADIMRMAERARYDYLNAIGYPAARLVRDGLLFVLTKIETVFFREVTEGRFSIRCRVTLDSEKHCTFEQHFLNASGKIAVELRCGSVLIDKRTRRAVSLPEELRRALTILASASAL